jgi:Tol biopolymer transport system component/predicted Ser/Thr protein kinase
MNGTTVGHYEILEKLGEGGMGVVYKARDLLLNRNAALKFLPSDSVDAEDRRRRFVQEAQSASALNHPNIVTIYEVAQAGERDFIAMELVQGQALEKMIGRKPLPLGTVLDCGIQIADALAAAHAAGIVHRDLKPANVMVSDSGRVKVLDFGLAKLLAGGSGSGDASETMLLAESPQTVRGAIMGTVAYMSPEQAEGKPVDHRSDIFSFGAVLYEMLTARRAFDGGSTVSTLAAILTTEPTPLSAEAAGLPPELVRIVSRCLRKSPEKRWQSIADVRIALAELKQDLDAGQLDVPHASGPARRALWAPLAAAAIAAAGLTGFVAWRARPPAPPPDLWQVVRLTADAGASLTPAISRDGKLVTYVSDRAGDDTMDLWVQQIDTGDPVQLTRGLGVCRDPAFSPDASQIVLHCGVEPDGIYVVPTFGGLPKRLADGEGPQFSPDGSQISYKASPPGNGNAQPTIWIMPATGGAGKEIKVGKGMAGTPVWTPDGKGLLFIGFGDQANGVDDGDWYYVSAESGAVSKTGARQRLEAAGLSLGRNLAPLPGGVLFAHGGIESTNIYRMPLDPTFQKVAGDPLPIIVGAGFNFSPTASQDGRRATFAVGNNLSANIWKASIDARTGAVAGASVRITSGLYPSLSPSPSRDAKYLAYLGGSRRSPEIRLRDLAAGTDRRLAEAKDWSYVVLSPDGSTVAYSSDLRIGSAVYSVAASGGLPRKVCEACGRPVEWLSDKTKILIDSAGAQHRDIHLLDVASGQSKTIVQAAEFQVTMPHLSPDGRLLTFSSVRPGRARRIYAVPFNGEMVPEKDWILLVVGADLDRQPIWSPSGNAIYFQSDRDGARCVWGQHVDQSTGRAVGAPFAAHHMHQVRYNLNDIGDPAGVGLSMANGQLFYAAFELQSNVWMAERREPAAR